MNQQLSRNSFRDLCLKRDKYKCVICGKSENVVVHHVIERHLFGRSQGYFIDNGASVCEGCHLKCEMTIISVEEIRKACKIENIIVPDGFDPNIPIDKWGNRILPSGQRLKGSMFCREGVQKILKRGKVLHLFYEY